ncbi:hypothetical protein TNCV_4814171 [Trichonephila clavipes]|nr:hypothetical protein TNCV_4814171 [Trichonephila clavipes]
MLRRLVGITAPGHHDCSIQEKHCGIIHRDTLRLLEALGLYAKVGFRPLHDCRPFLQPMTLKVDNAWHTLSNTRTDNYPKQINVHDLQSHKPARPTAAFGLNE